MFREARKEVQQGDRANSGPINLCLSSQLDLFLPSASTSRPGQDARSRSSLTLEFARARFAGGQSPDPASVGL